MADGLVLRTESGFCEVLTDDGCRRLVTLAKKIKFRGRDATTLAVIGDRVRLRLQSDAGTVDEVLARRNELYRLAPGRKSLKDVLAANLDSLVVVQALARPQFNSASLDRILAIAEQAEIPTAVALNKSDLVPASGAAAIADLYRRAGYAVIICSAKSGEQIDLVREELRGVTALIGPSGVGKSSILNRISPGLQLRTAEISEATGKGRHTTVSSVLLEIAPGVYVADTPGLRSIGLRDIDRYEVAWLFREMQPLVGACRFPDCLHIQEPGCAVRAAVDEGSISTRRYNSYRRLLADVAGSREP